MNIMKMKLFLLRCLMLTMILSFASCAKDVEETDDEIQDRILKAYIAANYGNTLTSTASGIYIIDLEEGTGRAAADFKGAYIDYYSKYLNNVHSQYTYESVAKRIGEYSSSIYYGPNYYRINPSDSATVNIGVRELMNMLKEGGKVKAIIPPKLLNISGEKEAVSQTVLIYEIEMREVIDDIFQYQIDSLERFTARNYPGTDSLKYGLYYKKFTSKADTIKNKTNVIVNYIGKLLNGHVFETSVADTARKYGLTAGSALSVKWRENEDNMIDQESNSYVHGLSRAMKYFNYGDHGVIYFYSSLGYGAGGGATGGSIKGYTPLMFEVWVAEEN